MASKSPAPLPSDPSPFAPVSTGLTTDLYELTMAQAYFEHGVTAPASFSLFVRHLPPQRGYLVSAGLEGALDFLQAVRFSSDDIQYLESTGIFSGAFLEYLSGVTFTGDVWAIPEGRAVFANEPILEVTAPIIEAQIVETFLINQINLHTMITAKAARCVTAARGRTIVDFGFRRTQGVDAGLAAARCSWIAGFHASSNVLGGRLYGIPVSGTMAHSFVTAYESEIDSFRAFAATFPGRCTLLIDTYDTLDGAHKAVVVAREMEERGHRLQAVRLDSGDLLELSRGVRGIFDDAGLDYVRILASGGLDEYEIDALLRAGAPIDAFGVGTKLGVSADAPWLDMAYKMVEFDGRPVLKLSAGKRSLPGRKQVRRRFDAGGKMVSDVITLRDDAREEGEPLLVEVMRGGRAVENAGALSRARECFTEELKRLPVGLRELTPAAEYPVAVSERLAALAGEIAWRLAGMSERELGES